MTARDLATPQWKCCKPYPDLSIWYIDAADEPEPCFGFIATVSDVDGRGETNAHLIVAAVNERPALLELIGELIPYAKDAPPSLLKRAEKALREAGDE